MYFVNEESVADSNYVEIKYLVRHNLYSYDRTSGLLVSVLTSCLVVRGFEPRSGQTKDYNIDRIFIVLAHSLKRQSADRHVAPLGHIILIPRQSVFALSP
jgi:hypothetical protein